MNYYVIEPQINNNYLYIEHGDVHFPKEFALKSFRGKRIKNKFCVQIINRNPQSVMTDFIAGSNILPIVSKRFMNIIKNLESKNIQFLEASVINSRNKEDNTIYYYMNLLNGLNSIDLKESRFKVLYKDHDGIRREVSNKNFDFNIEKWRIRDTEYLKLKDEIVNDRCIFRENEIGTLIIINETLKNKIEETGLIGIDIQPLETYSY